MNQSEKYNPELEEAQEQVEYSFAFHPYNVILTLVLFSITALFLAFSAAFIYSRVMSNQPPIKLPSLFLFNTIILLGSSATLVWAKRCYKKDDTKGYQRALLYTLILSFLFLFMQIAAWAQLFSQDIFINSDTSAGYLYVISIMHFMHLVGGIPFLIVFLWKAYKRMKEPVSVLVYFSDPDKLLRLRLLTVYWHFLDGLWIYLIIFFFINYLIK